MEKYIYIYIYLIIPESDWEIIEYELIEESRYDELIEIEFIYKDLCK